MTNHAETCVSFGADVNCRIVPNVLAHNNVQLTLTFESKGPNGKSAAYDTVQLVGNPKKPFEVYVGDTDFMFSPQIAME